MSARDGAWIIFRAGLEHPDVLEEWTQALADVRRAQERLEQAGKRWKAVLEEVSAQEEQEAQPTP